MKELDLLTNENILEFNSNMATYFSDDSYQTFWQTIKNYPVLSSEENKKLIAKAQIGDTVARDKLIKCNLRLVVWIANKYKNRINHMHILDIIQEGNIGLMKSIETFNPEKGEFINHAIYCIKYSITAAISRYEDDIRKTFYFENKNKLYLKLLQEYKENKQDLPDDKVLCDLLEVSLETLFYIKNYNYQTISINQKNEENDRELEEFIIAEDNSYDEILEKQSNIDLFAILKEILLPKEYYIIYYRYLSDDKKTLEKIAQEFGITREAIRQTEVKVLAKIKSYMTDDSQVYKTKVKELHEQGIMLNDYNLMPINIEKIILFLYIIDDLTEYEKELMYYDVFGKMKFSWYRKILNISDANFFSIKQSIKEKLKKVILNKSEFYSFKEHILQNKGIKILDFTLNKTILFDYIHLKRKYDDLSYFEIMNLINENNIKLFKQETSLLKKYFLQINFRNIMPKEETEVVYKILAKIDNKKRKNEKNSMILRRKK